MYQASNSKEKVNKFVSELTFAKRNLVHFFCGKFVFSSLQVKAVPDTRKEPYFGAGGGEGGRGAFLNWASGGDVEAGLSWVPRGAGACCCRANLAHISRTRPDYGLSASHFQCEILENYVWCSLPARQRPPDSSLLSPESLRLLTCTRERPFSFQKLKGFSWDIT